MPRKNKKILHLPPRIGILGPGGGKGRSQLYIPRYLVVVPNGLIESRSWTAPKANLLAMLLAESRLGKDGFAVPPAAKQGGLQLQDGFRINPSWLVLWGTNRTTKHRLTGATKHYKPWSLGEPPENTSEKHWFLQIHNCQIFSSSFGNSHVFLGEFLHVIVFAFPVIQLGRNKFSIGSTSFPLKKAIPTICWPTKF